MLNPKATDAAPSFTYPASQFVTADQFDEPRFHEMLEWFGWGFGRNRKLWEYLYILNVLDREGLDGKRMIGFGCGREAIPGLLTSRGAEVVASDFIDGKDAAWWSSLGVDQLMTEHVVARGARRERVSFRHVDMNVIPDDLRDFDALWSCGALEHIGGLQAGLDFIVSAMDGLKPGGLAVHTTEYNASPGEDTLETPTLSLYREHHIRDVIDRLTAAGHHVDMVWERGQTEADRHVDRNQAYDLSIVADVCGFDTTSICLVVRKG